MGETNFPTREIPRSGSKAKDREKKKKKKRLNDGNNNGPATHGARKPPGPKTEKPIVDLECGPAQLVLI